MLCSPDHSISKDDVDTFLSTSGRQFTDRNGNKVGFVHHLWLSTTNKWSGNAEESLKNQSIPVTRRDLSDLRNAPIDWDSIYKGIHGLPARVPRHYSTIKYKR